MISEISSHASAAEATPRGETRASDCCRISLDRQARFGAGTLALLGVTLGFFVHPLFYALGLVVGVGLIIAGMTDVCGLTLVLARMPWNRRGPGTCSH